VIEIPVWNKLCSHELSPGFFHHALLTGLQPNTRYFVRPTQNGSLGDESSFVSGKELGPDQATRFVAFGDMYISSGEGEIREDAVSSLSLLTLLFSGANSTCKFLTDRVNGADDLDFLLHIGDLGYGRGSVAVWNTWLDLISARSQLVRAKCTLTRLMAAFLSPPAVPREHRQPRVLIQGPSGRERPIRRKGAVGAQLLQRL
jgi:hypothetical protein